MCGFSDRRINFFLIVYLNSDVLVEVREEGGGPFAHSLPEILHVFMQCADTLFCNMDNILKCLELGGLENEWNYCPSFRAIII